MMIQNIYLSKHCLSKHFFKHQSINRTRESNLASRKLTGKQFLTLVIRLYKRLAWCKSSAIKQWIWEKSALSWFWQFLLEWLLPDGGRQIRVQDHWRNVVEGMETLELPVNAGAAGTILPWILTLRPLTRVVWQSCQRWQHPSRQGLVLTSPSLMPTTNVVNRLWTMFKDNPKFDKIWNIYFCQSFLCLFSGREKISI